jgi:uncharacterized protein (TIGR03437 family)
MRDITRVIILTFLLTVFIPLAAAQNFDNSGDANLAGAYLFRYIAFSTTATTGAISEGCSLTGVINFDGKGNYTLSNTQRYDSVTSSGMCGAPKNGTYGVQPNGLAQLDNPIFSTTIFGSFSKPVLTGGSTEDGYYDLFVAVQAPGSSVSNSALSGSYRVGSMEFLNSQNAMARESWFTLNADGSGNVGALTVNGSAANLGNSSLTQNMSGATYTLSGNGAGTLNIPLPAGGSAQSQLVSGSKVLYISADGNYILGGSISSADIFFGFKAPASNANPRLNSTYFTAGIEADLSQLSSNSSFLDSFYGAVNANGSGVELWHERFNDVVDQVTYDNTFNSLVTGTGGVLPDGSYTELVSNNSQAFMLIGSGTLFALNIGVQAPAATPVSGVWINPLGVTNAANYTPITNSYAPGELINIYGTFGVSTQVAQTVPISTTLGGVQVKVNGTLAPVYLVSSTQVSALIPFATSGQNFAGIQVIVNGSASNTVTVFVGASAPGIYTLSQNGIGPSAVLHSNFTVVSAASPATPGETVSLFLNGLGTVNPQTADGAAGPSNPLSVITDQAVVYLDDGSNALAQATVTFAGLAPGFPGLYQVNFTLPSTGLNNGDVYIQLQTNEASTEMSTIRVSGFAGAAVHAASRGKSAVRPRVPGRRTAPRAAFHPPITQ